jgi:hypothetical protein
MKTTFAISLLLANTSAITFKQMFADGLDEETIERSDFVHDVAQHAGQINSGVRARWVELPDCTGASTDIVLAKDLHNATRATC